MKIKRLTAGFCLAVGILNLGMWATLLITGQVPLVHEQLISYLFHWFSEFTTAILLITAGIFLFRNPESSGAGKLYFLASGFLINAINGAAWYYLLNFSLPIFLMSCLILGFSLFLVIKNFRYREEINSLTTGIVLYGSINIIGYGFDRGDTSLLIYAFPMLLAVIMILLPKTAKPVQMN